MLILRSEFELLTPSFWTHMDWALVERGGKVIGPYEVLGGRITNSKRAPAPAQEVHDTPAVEATFPESFSASAAKCSSLS
jgi:hypothetical protein